MVIAFPTEESYRRRCEKRKARAAKLIAKGINPRSMKFLRLLYRRNP